MGRVLCPPVVITPKWFPENWVDTGPSITEICGDIGHVTRRAASGDGALDSVKVLHSHGSFINRGELLVEELGVKPALRQQLRMCAALNNFPALHDQDLIG